MADSEKYTLVWTATFERTARKLLRKHPELIALFRRLMENLQQDPFMPKLRLHPLSGKLKGKMSLSLTYSYRIILILQVSEREIILLDIGSHDSVY